ncbi:MAG: ribosome assembly RNA-binding protein YhbY [Gammaproteobacteria bacterium]|jgi:RNA-binding protein|nr:ribosome assembly RNA-binding protein YhbY [Gammaproteobacteria bacterium]
MKLTERQRKFLRTRAHALKPVIALGDKGVTRSFVDELNATLEHHELIKLKVRAGDRAARDAAIERLCADARAVLISRVGNVATLYRPRRTKPGIVLPVAGTG